MDFKQALLIIGITVFFTVIAPVIIFTILKRKGIIENFYMTESKERNLPYVIMIVFYSITTYVLQQVPLILPIFLLIFINSALVVFVVLIINSFTKISAHLASTGSLLAYLYNVSMLMKIDLILWIVGFILMAALLIMARLELKAHTKAQVYSGLLSGIVITSILIQSLFSR